MPVIYYPDGRTPKELGISNDKSSGDLIDYATSTAGQVLYNTAATPGYALQLVQGLAETPIQATRAMFDDDYSIKDAFADSWVNHNLGAKLNENVVDPIAENVFGRKSYDELNTYEKAGRLTGDFIPAFGVTKTNKMKNIVNKLHTDKFDDAKAETPVLWPPHAKS